MIKDLLNKLSSQEKEFLKQDILSPYVKGGSNIRVKLNGVVYKFKTPNLKEDGFGIFRAKNPNSVKFVRPAEFYEKEEYLNLLPKVELVLVCNLNRWLAYPLYSKNFLQRFKMEPKLVSVLCAENVEVMDNVVARFDGANFWFENLKLGFDVSRSQILRDIINTQNYTITKDMMTGMSQEEIKAFDFACNFHKEANMSSLEKRLRNELGKYGAELDSFTERGENVSVRWKDNQTKGQYTTVLDKENLGVITAGICLSGGDKKFDIQSLVGIVREAGNGRIVHVGEGGMDDERYWDTYRDYEDGDWYDD